MAAGEVPIDSVGLAVPGRTLAGREGMSAGAVMAAIALAIVAATCAAWAEGADGAEGVAAGRDGCRVTVKPDWIARAEEATAVDEPGCASPAPSPGSAAGAVWADCAPEPALPAAVDCWAVKRHPVWALGSSEPVAMEMLSTEMASAITLTAQAKAAVVRHSRSYERDCRG